MAIVTTADVLAAAKRCWHANAFLQLLVPGQLWHDRVPPEASTPYATLQVTEGAIEGTSGAPYWQRFPVTIRVYSVAGPGNAGLIQQTLNTAFDRATVLNGAFTILGATILNLEPMPGSLQTDPVMKDAKDVLVARWDREGWVQSTR